MVRNLDDINLPYFTTEITTKSSPYALALAKHLNSIGAKMYGAFWCSHCVEQKEVLYSLQVVFKFEQYYEMKALTILYRLSYLMIEVSF